jgi:desulfoferrodoxin-like iron-binding protein
MAAVKIVGEIWRCDVCGNVVEVRKVGGGQLICCGGPMIKVSGESNTDEKTHAMNETTAKTPLIGAKTPACKAETNYGR